MTLEYKPNPGWAEIPAGAAKFVVCVRLRDGSFRGGFTVDSQRWTIEGKPDDIIEYATVTRGKTSAQIPSHRSAKRVPAGR